MYREHERVDGGRYGLEIVSRRAVWNANPSDRDVAAAVDPKTRLTS